MLTGLSAGFYSCVPARKFQDAQAQIEKMNAENADCKKKTTDLQAQLDKLKDDFDKSQNARNELASDTADYGQKYRKIESLNKELNSLYEQVIGQNKELLSHSTSEAQKMQSQLDEQKTLLDSKQKQLDQLQVSLNQQKHVLDSLNNGFIEKDKKVKQLESLLNRQDSAVNALKNRISDALLGYENSGDLKVSIKNGKVYVSLSENLLFKSGKTDVDPKGKEALKKLAEVLAKNPDIKVDVEGHTDNVQFTDTKFPKDNWDLSVLRATSVVRIILGNENINPSQISASGLADTDNVASNDTPEGRAKNRRTEIILSPDFSQLFKMLNIK
jgi:chemotaxis protein MotB